MDSRLKAFQRLLDQQQQHFIAECQRYDEEAKKKEAERELRHSIYMAEQLKILQQLGNENGNCPLSSVSPDVKNPVPQVTKAVSLPATSKPEELRPVCAERFDQFKNRFHHRNHHYYGDGQTRWKGPRVLARGWKSDGEVCQSSQDANDRLYREIDQYFRRHQDPLPIKTFIRQPSEKRKAEDDQASQRNRHKMSCWTGRRANILGRNSSLAKNRMAEFVKSAAIEKTLTWTIPMVDWFNQVPAKQKPSPVSNPCHSLDQMTVDTASLNCVEQQQQIAIVASEEPATSGNESGAFSTDEKRVEDIDCLQLAPAVDVIYFHISPLFVLIGYGPVPAVRNDRAERLCAREEMLLSVSDLIPEEKLSSRRKETPCQLIFGLVFWSTLFHGLCQMIFLLLYALAYFDQPNWINPDCTEPRRTLSVQLKVRVFYHAESLHLQRLVVGTNDKKVRRRRRSRSRERVDLCSNQDSATDDDLKRFIPSVC